MKLVLLICLVAASTIDAQGFGGKRPNSGGPGFGGKRPGSGGPGFGGKRPNTGGPGVGGRRPGSGFPGDRRSENGEFDIDKVCENREPCQSDADRPVCGTDGITYSNPCQLLDAKCDGSPELTIKYRAECGSEVTSRPGFGGPRQRPGFGGPRQRPTGTRRPPVFGERRERPNENVEFDIDKVCENREPCPSDADRPVCGNDGITYSSPCRLLDAKCDGLSDLKIEHRGECGSEVTGRPGFGGPRQRPGFGRHGPGHQNIDIICEMSRKCEPKFERQVCGSNNETYDTLCDFLAEKCENNDTETVIVPCEEYPLPDPEKKRAFCESRYDRCANRTSRLHRSTVICGSDNVTYENECEFKIAKCMDIFLTVAKRGECTEDQGNPEKYCVKCPFVAGGNRGRPRPNKGFMGKEENEGFGGRFNEQNNRPEGGRPNGGRPEGGRPQGGRPEGGRPEGGRPQGGRPEGGRPEGGRPQGGRPEGGRPEGGRPEGGRPEGGRPQGGRPEGGRPEGGRPEGGRPQGGRPEGGRPEGGRPEGGRPEGGRPEGGRPEGGRPEGGRPQGGRPEGGRPEGGRPEGGRLEGGRAEGSRLEEGEDLEGGRPGPHHGGRRPGPHHGGRRPGPHHGGRRPGPHHGRRRPGPHHGGHRPHHRGLRPGEEFPEFPVCGTDGLTYSSACELKRTACLLRDFDLDIESVGPCATPTPDITEVEPIEP